MLLLPVVTLGLGLPAVGEEKQPHVRMLREPDVSKTQVAFAYANDLWLAPREGGEAVPLASPPGIERNPRFSPDGQQIAFMANYDGNPDIYVMPVTGGPPRRVTYHPAMEWLCDWTADGKLVFFAGGMGAYPRAAELYVVDANGGLPEKLPVPYGANGAISEDGKWLAYTPHSRDHRTWKRYRGGMATDVWLFNLERHTARRITDWEGTDTQPMWHGDKVYYLSDEGPEHRLNIWEYDVKRERREQITDFSEDDVKWPAIGPGARGRGEIVFECGPDLYLLNLANKKSRRISVAVPGDLPKIRPQLLDVDNQLFASNVSSTGKRAVFEARGDIWTVPAKNGAPRNLTRSDGVAERDPAWSPDGQWVAYFSDESGEYELYIRQSDGKGGARALTHDSSTYYYDPNWSPDSKFIAFHDKTGTGFVVDVESATVKEIDRNPWGGSLGRMSWSHDSRWIAYAKAGDNRQSALWLYDRENDERHQVTSGVFSDSWPAFDRKGEHLYFARNLDFGSPVYEDFGATFVYTNTDRLLLVPLRKDVKSPFLPKIDEEEWKKDDQDKDKDKDENGDEDEEKAGEKSSGDEKDSPATADTDEDDDEAAADDGVSGVWEGTVKGPEPLPPEGLPLSMTLAVDDEGQVTGNLKAGPFTADIKSGEYDKESGELSLTIEVGTEEGALTFHVAAKITNGEMSGTVTGEDFEATFEAKRVRAAEEEAEEDDDEESTDGKKKKDKKEIEPLKIDLEGFDERAILLPVGRGSFHSLLVNEKGHLVYVRSERGGEENGIKIFNAEDDEPKEEAVLGGVGGFSMSADGKKLLVRQGNRWAIINAATGQKFDKTLSLAGMKTEVDPRHEWGQVFHDAWRIYRDFFYDPHMHGVDWKAIGEHYGDMLPFCVSRDDVSFLIREMISELNVGHAYYMGGDSEGGPRESIGLLGCDFDLEDGAYRITRIYAGAEWDADARGPLSQPGVDVHEGDYLLAVDGVPLDTELAPWAAFQGKAERVVTLTVSTKPERDEDAREVIVQTLSSDGGLRYRAWIEANRRHVDEASDGKVGYVYVPNTGVDGQNNLFRQFYGQRDKAALIIDERWNGGGQIPDRFVELLNRPITNYFARRDSHDSHTPGIAHAGPKCMLINGLAGSGGDMFPALFRQAGLGKLIGTRTWGGLVGLSGNPRLIDGASVAVPRFAYYELNGTWGIEGHGVDPDLEVIDDPEKMADGQDVQLDAAIELMLEEIERNGFTPPERPPYPDRSGMGIREEDK